MGKPGVRKQRKERESDKDTVVAYHEFLQGRIHGELNGVSIGPGQTLTRFAVAFFVFGFFCMIIGILVITLRHRHVYLISWDDQFLGPFFIVMFLLCCAVATFLLLLAKRRTNQYRRDLAFRPIGDYGVAVVHKSKLSYDEQKKTELKSGTTPHNVRHPGRPGVNDRGNRGDYSRSRGYDNRGYKDDYDRERRRERDRERGKDARDGRPRDDRPRDDRPRDRPPRRNDDRERRPRPEGEKGRENRGRRGDDPNKKREPLTPEEEQKRREARRRYEEDKRRRYEEDKRRAELRKQAEAEAESYDRMERTPSQERGIDVDPDQTRTYQIQTTVKLSREIQDTDESAI